MIHYEMMMQSDERCVVLLLSEASHTRASFLNELRLIMLLMKPIHYVLSSVLRIVVFKRAIFVLNFAHKCARKHYGHAHIHRGDGDLTIVRSPSSHLPQSYYFQNVGLLIRHCVIGTHVSCFKAAH